jgi:hypothetical protein
MMVRDLSLEVALLKIGGVPTGVETLLTLVMSIAGAEESKPSARLRASKILLALACAAEELSAGPKELEADSGASSSFIRLRADVELEALRGNSTFVATSSSSKAAPPETAARMDRALTLDPP